MMLPGRRNRSRRRIVAERQTAAMADTVRSQGAAMFAAEYAREAHRQADAEMFGDEVRLHVLVFSFANQCIDAPY